MPDKKLPSTSTWMLWAGRIISAVLAVLLSMSALMKFTNSPELTEGMTHLGWPTHLAVALGITELTCAILYAIPQTSVLGAILLTGYLGGAIATHARIGEYFLIQIGIGVLVWLGLYLRDHRLRALLPLRR
jgi:uncharacterized membrane protein YphA (DoxX/SURF4 family)